MSLSYAETAIYTVFGMPNYGESIKQDQVITEAISQKFEYCHMKVINDCEAGWAGSLVLEPGINIIAGTGSIAFGKNAAGETGRAGGWNDFFSDEGSGKWMGLKTMEYFFKQADGRLPKGPLYNIVRAFFQVKEDVEVVDIFEEIYQPYRDKTASLYRLLLQAAEQGDLTVIQVYNQAGMELAAMVRALYYKLQMKDVCKVSYSGGLFQSGDYLLDAMKMHLRGIPFALVQPKSVPVIGAVLLAGYYHGFEIPTQYLLKGDVLCI